MNMTEEIFLMAFIYYNYIEGQMGHSAAPIQCCIKILQEKYDVENPLQEAKKLNPLGCIVTKKDFDDFCPLELLIAIHKSNSKGLDAWFEKLVSDIPSDKPISKLYTS